MKLMSKCSALGAVLVLSSAFVSAETITLGSYGNATVGTPSNTAVKYTGYNASMASGVTTNNAPAGTFNISSGDPSVWAPAGANSSWVSFDAQTGPTGTHVVSNGTYTYTTTFTTHGPNYAGTLSVLADDTTDIYLNGVQVIPSGIIGGDAHCSDNVPTCMTVETIQFNSQLAGFNNNGVNVLTFNVKQTGQTYEGLDFYGSITSTPEPSTLMLLGTGLLGSAGALFRRMKSVA